MTNPVGGELVLISSHWSSSEKHDNPVQQAMHYITSRYNRPAPPRYEEPPMPEKPKPVVLHTTAGLPDAMQAFISPFTQDWNKQLVDARKTEDQKFAELDVQPGDRIRLTETVRAYDWHRSAEKRSPKEDGAVLEGVVKNIKFRHGQYRVQVEGFDVSGNAIYWPVRNYHVEVLHRAYRWQGDDRLIAELNGDTETEWKARSETSRERLREEYGKRAAKIKRIVGA